MLESGKVYKSDFKPGFVELSSIGIVACNNRWFDVGIQWLQQAFQVFMKYIVIYVMEEKYFEKKVAKKVCTNC